jgi:hypothetical protein
MTIAEFTILPYKGHNAIVSGRFRDHWIKREYCATEDFIPDKDGIIALTARISLIINRTDSEHHPDPQRSYETEQANRVFVFIYRVAINTQRNGITIHDQEMI